MQTTLEILKKLVSFKTITPLGAECMSFIASFLKDFGFKITDLSKNDTSNLFAVKKISDTCKNLMYAGHIDVVDVIDISQWKNDPFNLCIEDDFVYARGVVDMKGSIACFLSALKLAIENKTLKYNIGILLTSDEEGSAKDGITSTINFLKTNDFAIDYILLGEPTSENHIADTIKIGRRGSMNITVVAKGRAGHVAYPEKTINPIYSLIDLCKRLKNISLDNGNEHFEPSNLEVVDISSNNQVVNVIPDSIKATINIRFNNEHTADSLISIINTEISKIKQKNLNIELDCYYTVSALPFVSKKNDNFINLINQAVQKECGYLPKISCSGGTSDARFLHELAPIVELGLKNDTAHKINESTSISDLKKMQAIYYNILSMKV